jgi:hypothetical protein
MPAPLGAPLLAALLRHGEGRNKRRYGDAGGHKVKSHEEVSLRRGIPFSRSVHGKLWSGFKMFKPEYYKYILMMAV